MDIKIKNCGKYVDGAIVSTAQSVPCQGTLRHVIDLHAQARICFYYPLYPSRAVSLLYSTIRLAITPHAQVKEKEDKCVSIERPCGGLGGPTSLGFGRFCSFSFAVCTWPLTDILSTHTRIQWYTRVTLDPHTRCHCMRLSQ
jgi:hypothetical protein